MIAKLYEYFGVLGILSMAVWIGAIVVMGLYARKQRQGYCLLALGVAILAVVLAHFNSAKVSAIQLDRRDEIAAAQKAQREATEAAGESGSVAPVLQFAEGDPEDAVPDYRKRGKQTREKGKRSVQEAAVAEDDGGTPQERFMREPDLLAANRLDRVNLMAVRLVLLIALGLLVWDYLRWFNATLESRWPLPIGGRWLDGLFRKSHVVWVGPHADPRMNPVPYVERVVRKGENFIYFGDGDPWAGNRFVRVALWSWTLRALPKLPYGTPGFPQGSEFALDAAWFGRYGVVIPQAEMARLVLSDIADLLVELRDTGAVARKTLHLILDFRQTLPMDDVKTLMRVARDTNIKVVVLAHESEPPDFAGQFEEQFGDGGR